jgi:hypothetical protein
MSGLLEAHAPICFGTSHALFLHRNEEIALPMLFHRLPRLRLTGPAAEEYAFEGRAIHGVRELPVAW